MPKHRGMATFIPVILECLKKSLQVLPQAWPSLGKVSPLAPCICKLPQETPQAAVDAVQNNTLIVS